jgi:uncharacterized Fe-S cluster-containing radical SAM superfamily enzyme
VPRNNAESQPQIDLFELRVAPLELGRLLRLSEQDLARLTKANIIRRETAKRNGRRVYVYKLGDAVGDYFQHLEEPAQRAREEFLLEKSQTQRIVRAHKELELQYARGDMVKRSIVLNAMSNAVSVVKNNVLGLPTRLARQLLGQTDYHKVHALLHAACVLVLREMVNFDINSIVIPDRNGQYARDDTTLERRTKRATKDRRQRSRRAA